jgi:uncharacterized membrane protein AbrB (regulator of aidB expression)
MVLGAEECGANSKLVGLVHMIRIFLTVFTIPTIILFYFLVLLRENPYGQVLLDL